MLSSHSPVPPQDNYPEVLSTKLFISFALCALITLVVGIIGSQGIGDLSNSLKLTFSNNLVSVGKTSETKANAIASFQ